MSNKKSTDTQPKSEVVEEVKKTKTPAPTHSFYKNTTKRNVFTSAGCVHAGREVFIPVEEGKITKGLEECQK